MSANAQWRVPDSRLDGEDFDFPYDIRDRPSPLALEGIPHRVGTYPAAYASSGHNLIFMPGKPLLTPRSLDRALRRSKSDSLLCKWYYDGQELQLLSVMATSSSH